MILKKWKDIPEEIKSVTTKQYYDLLRKKKLSIILKRIFDILVSFIMLVIASPIFLVLAIAIKIDSKGPVFYRQERITQYNRKFRIFKFRTMVQNADKIGSLITLGQDSRITRIGKIIRKCRLDELPQLINVLLGDMTFVGTRPEVKKYVDCYSEDMKATLLMKAGVTSLASMLYRNEDEIMNKYIAKGETIDEIYVNRVLPDKMKYNLEYIEKFSIVEDIKIMINTVLVVLKLKRLPEDVNGQQDENEIKQA